MVPWSRFPDLYPGVPITETGLEVHWLGLNMTVATNQLDGVERRGHHVLEVTLAGDLEVLPGMVDDDLTRLHRWLHRDPHLKGS